MLLNMIHDGGVSPDGFIGKYWVHQESDAQARVAVAGEGYTVSYIL